MRLEDFLIHFPRIEYIDLRSVAELDLNYFCTLKHPGIYIRAE